MKKNWITILVSAAALLLLTSQVAAGYDGYGRTGTPRADCPQMSGYWASALDLTETQVDKLRIMRQDFITQNSALREELFSRQQEMRQLWAGSDVDRERIRDKQAEINELKARLSNEAIDHRLRIRNEVLTGEQQEKLTQMMQNREFRKGHRGDWSGKRGRSGGRMGW